MKGSRRREFRPRKVSWRFFGLMLLGVFSMVSTILSIVSIVTLEKSGASNPIPGFSHERTVSKIAFGSCTAPDYSPQPVWVHGVIPSDPDAWIWLGDMAYLDEPRVNCKALPSHPHCNCTGDWLRQAPFSCMAGDVNHATSRMQTQLSNPDYAQFLAFMCPDHRARGLFPPTGTDPSICPRRIFGTYDDHDYSWRHGNSRLPRKDELKQIFLDAIGESNASPRRDSGRGIEWKYSLNEALPGQKIDVFLLDERYNRGTLPCHMRRKLCEDILSKDDHPRNTWCWDFLYGGESGRGSCCSKDDEIFYGWCMQEGNKKSTHYAEACDPTSPFFGARPLTVDSTGTLLNSLEWGGRAESPFCEVLGKDQRLWLQESLRQSNAVLKLIASSSVVLGNPKSQICESEGISPTNLSCLCSGDDWECYKPAQLQLLHSLSETSGCVVILTGDFQFSDIKVLRPGKESYSDYYGGIDLSYPLYQVMSSGLTKDTARKFNCNDFSRDPVGLRDHPECDFVQGPSFGMVETPLMIEITGTVQNGSSSYVYYVEHDQVEWDAKDPVIRLQVRDGMTSAVRLESSFTLSSCQFRT